MSELVLEQRTASDWEDRARALQTDVRSVLFKSLPPRLNRFLHEWHVGEARRALEAATMGQAAHVLDVGCGYGRLSRALRATGADVHVVGIDLSATFANLFPEYAGGPAVIGDLQALPIRARCFDLVLLVTTLMYVPEAQRAAVVAQCLNALRPQGRLLIVETSRHGRWIYSGFGTFTWLATMFGAVEMSVETGGHAFTYPEIETLVQKAGGEVIRRSGVPVFTCLLPVLVALSKLGAGSIAERLLRLCTPSNGTRKYSLHVCYEVRRVQPPGVAV